MSLGPSISANPGCTLGVVDRYWAKIRGKVITFTGKKIRITSTPCTNQIRDMSCTTSCKIGYLVRLANSVVTAAEHIQTADSRERVTNEQLLSHNVATLLPPSSSRRQHHARGGGGISAVYRSLQAITEDSQSWGCGRMQPDLTARSLTATRNANPLQCSSVSCCAGSSSVRFSINYACLLSPLAYLMYTTTTTHRLCCSGSAAGIVYGTLYLVYML